MITPPLTIFTLPKSFTGHTAVIQHNAIQSWLRMEPRPEIFLLGDDSGVMEYATRYGLKHFSNIARNEQGTPLISSIFREGQALAMTQYVAYVNADIMLNGLTQTVSAENLPEIFLMVGRRKDLVIWEEWDFSVIDWHQKLEELVEREGRWHTCWGIDFFLFPKGIFEEIPCFAVGKVGWDNWMLSSVLNRNIPLIDTTRTVQAFHQEHTYNHIPNGYQESRDGVEARQNKQLVGAKKFSNILDATHCLNQGKIQPIYQGYQFPEFRNGSFKGLCFTHRVAQQAYIQGEYDFCAKKLQEINFLLISNSKEMTPEEQKKFKKYQEEDSIPPQSQHKHTFVKHKMKENMTFKNNAFYMAQCPLCGSKNFLPGHAGRLNKGFPPLCAGCKSLERHRIIQLCYAQLPQDLLNTAKCLHFAPDRAVESCWFKEYESSVYGGKNSVDMQNIERPDAHYDWVICNYLLQNVADDAKAMQELLRITKYSGVIQFAIPSPLRVAKTKDWGFPDEKLFGHYRTYGEDFMEARFAGVLNEHNIYTVIGTDPVTGDQDAVFFVSKSPTVLARIMLAFSDTKSIQSHTIIPSLIVTPNIKLSTNKELETWYHKYPAFIKHRAQGIDYMNANLKLIQDLCMCDFITNNIQHGAKVLEIGGGVSRILPFFADKIEGWNLDKFEGVGSGPRNLPQNVPYRIVQNDIGAFDTALPENYFDLVFSISVVEHINLEDNYLENIILDIDRVLKPGGLNVHCIDCRFSVGTIPDISNRRLLKYMVKKYGFNESYIYENYMNPETFVMSKFAYDKYWKKACNNRPCEIDGLPFNVFLVTQKTS